MPILILLFETVAIINIFFFKKDVGALKIPDSRYDTSKVGKNETETVISLKHLSNFWKTLNILLINCEIELILTWSKNCVLANMTRRNAQGNNPAIIPPRERKLYVPVVTLSKENDIKLLEQLNAGFKRTIKWKKYRPQMTIQNSNNNLNI